MASALDVAKYMIIRAKKDKDDYDLTPLKLQKLCYYALGVYSKRYNKKLFDEDVEAWRYGPVIRSVYNFATPDNILNFSEDYDDLDLDIDERNTIDEAYVYFSQYSAWKLSEMTHSEAPWKDNHQSGSKNVIPFDDIHSYFDKALTID